MRVWVCKKEKMEYKMPVFLSRHPESCVYICKHVLYGMKRAFCFYFSFRCYHRNWIAQTNLSRYLSICLSVSFSPPFRWIILSSYPRLKHIPSCECVCVRL